MPCEPYQLNTEEACPEKAAGERSTSHFIAKDTPLNTIGRATSVLNIVHICFLRRVPSKEGLAGDLRVTKNVTARCQRSVRCGETGSSRSLTVQSEAGREPARNDPQASGAKQAHTPRRKRRHESRRRVAPFFHLPPTSDDSKANTRTLTSPGRHRVCDWERHGGPACFFTSRTRLRWRTTHIAALAKRWASS